MYCRSYLGTFCDFITSITVRKRENVFNCHDPHMTTKTSSRLVFPSLKDSADCVISFLAINWLSINKQDSVMG